MTECDRCGDDTFVARTLRNVSFDKSPVSALHSRYKVCGDCYAEMKEDDDITWDGAHRE